MKRIFTGFLLLASVSSFATDTITGSVNQFVELSQNVEFNIGDIITLKNSNFSVKIGVDSGPECAMPDFNCGKGYRPPAPSYIVNCGNHKTCPYVLLITKRTATSGSLSIENEKSCDKKESSDRDRCLLQLAVRAHIPRTVPNLKK